MKFQDIPKLYQANYKINMPWNYMGDWLERIGSDYGLELEPSFQRGHCWTEEKRIAYVEYVLAGGPSAREIQWNCYGWGTLRDVQGPMVLVDGLQRLTSVRMFLDNKLKAYGHLFKEFEDKMSWSEHWFLFFVNNLPTRKHVLEWYIQLNAGGVVHTASEIDKVREMLEQEIKNGKGA